MPSALWQQHFRRRIWLGLERCRKCGLVSTDLTFDHILPKSRGGRYTIKNITILCIPCQHLKGNDIWSHQVSLWDEGYRGEVVLLPMVAPPPKPPLTRKQKARRQRRDDKNFGPKVCPPDCICSSCEFWRGVRICGP